MKMNLSATVAGVPVQVTTRPSDAMAFERHYGKGAPAALRADNFRIEYGMWLMWHALKREGRTSADFDSWVETVDDLGVEGEAPAAPLAEEVSTG